MNRLVSILQKIDLSSIDVSAIIQIVILYLVIYSILKAARGTRFGQALMGVGLVSAVMFALTFVFSFDVLTTIVQALLVYLAISTVVIFQPEIRRLLVQLGAFGYLETPKFTPEGVPTAEHLVDSILRLAKSRTGALIAFERGISLRGYEQSGVRIDARFSRELLECLFTPPLPLHDGGVTIRNGRIAAAHCVFPVSVNDELSTSGMRHRAAVGLSEETDALVIVVSEERGSVSVASNGKLTRYPDAAQSRLALVRWVSTVLPAARDGSGFLNRFHKLLMKGIPRR